MLKIHHINCATMCPPAGYLLNSTGRLVCHCLLIESDAGLILVDTGIGFNEISNPRENMDPGLRIFTRPELNPENTALGQVKKAGFTPDDVKHIVVTHLDLDHSGGIPDFPKAKVHVLDVEYHAAMKPARLIEKNRYRKQHWQHNPEWEIYEYKKAEKNNWFNFEAIRILDFLKEEIFLIPTFGHTRGHCAVAVKHGKKWLVHAGDSYFHYQEINPEKPYCTAGLRLFQHLMQVDKENRLRNQEKLRKLLKESYNEIDIFCAHDPYELKRLGQK